MADDMEAMLRNSLDAVDRGRRWAMLGFGALVLATILALGVVVWTGARMAAPPPAFWGVLNIMWAAFIAETLLLACCTAIVMFHVSRVGRTLLKAIELSKGNNS